ncbi:AMP-binding protein [Shigella flexneri]
MTVILPKPATNRHYLEGDDASEQTYPIKNCIATSAASQRPAGLGIKKGDVVAIYMPMVPEAAVAMLACARIGASTPLSSAAFPLSGCRAHR